MARHSYRLGVGMFGHNIITPNSRYLYIPRRGLLTPTPTLPHCQVSHVSAIIYTHLANVVLEKPHLKGKSSLRVAAAEGTNFGIFSRKKFLSVTDEPWRLLGRPRDTAQLQIASCSRCARPLASQKVQTVHFAPWEQLDGAASVCQWGTGRSTHHIACYY